MPIDRADLDLLVSQIQAAVSTFTDEHLRGAEQEHTNTLARLVTAVRQHDAVLICPHCAAGHPHRSYPESSISGPKTRRVYDLHEKPNVGGAELVECWAAAIWNKITEEATP